MSDWYDLQFELNAKEEELDRLRARIAELEEAVMKYETKSADVAAVDVELVIDVYGQDGWWLAAEVPHPDHTARRILRFQRIADMDMRGE